MEKERIVDLSRIFYEGLMIVEVFKTNVEHEQEADHLLFMLSESFPCFDSNFDLEDCDHILRIEGYTISSEQIIAFMIANGYQCKALNE